MTQAITLYGIFNCDAVQSARAWLVAQGEPHDFCDFKKAGVPADALDGWLAAAGWEAVLNRRGTTWRKLGDAERAAVVDAVSARVLLLAQPSAIKRPVVRWADGAITVGFDPAAWSARLQR